MNVEKMRVFGRMLSLESHKNKGEVAFFRKGEVTFLDRNSGLKYRIQGDLKWYDRFLNFTYDVDRNTGEIISIVGNPTRIPFSTNLFAEMLMLYSGKQIDGADALIESMGLLEPCEISEDSDKEKTEENGGYDFDKVLSLEIMSKISHHTIYFYVEEYVTLVEAFPSKREELKQMEPRLRKKYYDLFVNNPEILCYKSSDVMKFNKLGMYPSSKLRTHPAMLKKTEEEREWVVSVVEYYQDTLLKGWVDKKLKSQNSTLCECKFSDWEELNFDREVFNYIFNVRKAFKTIWLPFNSRVSHAMIKNGEDLKNPKNPEYNFNLCRYVIEGSTQTSCEIIANRLSRLFEKKNKLPPAFARCAQLGIPKEDKDTDYRVKKLTRPNTEYWEKDTQLNPEQKDAITRCCAGSPVVIITGGPGTGKTSKCLAHIWKSNETEYLILSNAGVAVDRVRVSIQSAFPGSEPRVETIAHVEKSFELNPLSKYMYTTMLIIDEASTFDVHSFRNVIIRMPYLQQIVLIGDINQTSPIGKGYPYRDMIRTLKKCTVRLKKNHRTGSARLHANNANFILRSTSKLNDIRFANGKLPRIEDLQCAIIPSFGDTYMNTKRILTYLECGMGPDYVKNHVQFITPYRRMCDEYIRCIKAFIYGEKVGNLRKGEVAVGQRVIFRKNVKAQERDGIMSDQVRNGEVGVISTIHDIGQVNGKTVTVSRETTQEEFCPSGWSRWIVFKNINGERKNVCTQLVGNNIFDASCITGHSSQGCEYKTVVIVLPKFSKKIQHILNVNLLYTMYTRAKEQVIIVYEDEPVEAPDDECDVIIKSLGSFTNIARAKRPVINSYLWFELLMISDKVNII